MREKTVLLALLIALVLIPAANASLITFSDSAIFICEGAPFTGNSGCGTNVLTFGTLTLVAAGSGTQSVNTPADTPFADFFIRCADGTTTCEASTFASDTLALQLSIVETSPIAANGSIADAQIAAVGGGTVTVSGSSSNAQAQWTAGTSLVLGNTQYSIVTNPLNLVPPNTNVGDTTVSGGLTDVATGVPEPAPWMLVGAGLIGLTLLNRWRTA